MRDRTDRPQCLPLRELTYVSPRPPPFYPISITENLATNTIYPKERRFSYAPNLQETGRRLGVVTNTRNFPFHPVLQVLRYSALAFGVFYGFTHQRSINASQRAAEAQKEYENKQRLIQQAKAEYAKSKNPPKKNSGRTFFFLFNQLEAQGGSRDSLSRGGSSRCLNMTDLLAC